jgi:predicted O-methyltransferase YrrM
VSDTPPLPDRVKGFARRAMWNVQFPPGSYYSPVPSHADVRARQDELFAPRATVPGIDLRDEQQLALVQEFGTYYPEIPFRPTASPPLRYYLDNLFFGYGDGVMLYSMLRHHTPAHVVEIGSGYSSALMLDVNDRHLDGAATFTFVDPDTRRLDALLSPSDRRRHRVIQRKLQDVDDREALFDQLGPNDVLFIDSSHVSKTGSDVNYLLFEVLPSLAPGVIVHIHDVFASFEYPREWVLNGRAWNEAYLVRAFLIFNPSFEILIFNAHLKEFHRAEVADVLPLWEPRLAGSLWLRRI